MRANTIRFAIALSIFVATISAVPAGAQNLQNITPSTSRIFPGVSGALAMRQDDAGRFYVLAPPATAVLIFDAAGNQIGQIPNARSSGATLRYAADLDLAPDGALVVADRGGNAIYVFGPDGSLDAKINIFAPTSVVALPNGQFGITSLRTDHPVEIIDDQGRVVRGFGDPAATDTSSTPSNPALSFENAPEPVPTVLADLGRLTGDAAGHLYFAKVSASAPEVRKYDRFGYISYAAEFPPASALDPGTVQDDRVQLSFNFGRLSRSDQISGFTTIGNSGKMQFGGGVGTGLGAMLGHGGGGMRGGGFGLTGNDFGSDNSGLPALRRGGLAGTVTGDASIQDASLHLHLGVKANQRRNRAAAAANSASGSSPAQSTSQDPNDANAVLQYGSSSYFQNSDDDSDVTDTSALQFQSSDSSDASALNGPDYSAVTDADFGPSVGGSPGFLLGGVGPRPGFGQRRFGGEGFPGERAGGPAMHPGFGPGAGPGSLGATPAAGAAGEPRFGPHGRYSASSFDFLASIRINLDKRHAAPVEDKSLTAVAVDRKTEEIWAASGAMLVHFDKDGAQLDTYYLSTPEGAPLQATAILILPDKLIVGSDSRGVYEFARPDKAAASRPLKPAAPPQPSESAPAK